MTEHDIYLDRLQALKETFPMIREKDAEEKVDLNIYVTECGTGHCILGWWAMTQRAKDDGWLWDNDLPIWGGWKTLDAAETYFGISPFHTVHLFGAVTGIYDTITHREQIVDELIDERMVT